MINNVNWADWDDYFVEWAKEFLSGPHWPDLKWEYGDTLVAYIDRVINEPSLRSRTPLTVHNMPTTG
jgi:hypothetical protein